MKKKLLAFLLCGVLLAGCGPAAPETAEPDAPETAETVEDAEVVETAETADYSGGSPWLDTDLKANITEGMETSPKDDFHLYVNYEWLKNAEFREGYSTATPFLDVELETAAKTQAMLEDETVEGHDAELVRTLYNAFLDWDARNEQGMDPVLPGVEAVQNVSTLQDLTALMTDPDWLKVLSIPADYGNDAGLDDATVNVLWIGHGALYLSDAAEYQTRTEYGERLYTAYQNAAQVMLCRAGYPEADAAALYERVIAFEGEIAEKCLTSADQMSPDYISKINNPLTWAELAARSPAFPLPEMLKAEGYGKAKVMVVEEPEWLDRVNELYTEERLEDWKAWLLTHFLTDNMACLDRDAYELSVETTNAISGSTGTKPDEEEASAIVEALLVQPLGKAYLAMYDAAKMKEDIRTICEEVIAEYREMLDEAWWLSIETREKAVSKLDHITINAVYPDKWADYDKLSLKGLSLFECMGAIAAFETERNSAKTNQPVDRANWGDMDILQANAFYNPSDNSINIILGLLGGPFYDEGMTEEAMLGGIGSVIGHEISHAFDPTGAQFDENGNFSMWWTEADYAAFQERVQKLIDYYDNIVVYGDQHAVGDYVQGEASADMTGMECLLRIAKTKDNFDYDSFFRQYAAIWARLNTPESEYSSITQDPHPVHYLRTNVTVQQFEEFMTAYGVEEGDGMYLAPEDRLLIW